MTFDGLDAGAAFPGLGVNSLQALLGLFLRCQGRFGTFLYTDPTDGTVAAGAVGIGDGATRVFPALRTLGGFSEPIGWVTALRAVTVDGVPADGWSLAAPNRIVLPAAPAAGAVIGADFDFAYLCRFLDDIQDFENVMAGLWKAEGVKFRSVRPHEARRSRPRRLPGRDARAGRQAAADGGLLHLHAALGPDPRLHRR
ncbi:DUF2460 domain-containing protein [Methylobacterium sp. P5_C11]